MAVNRAGQSQPSNQTEPQLIKATKAPPKIDRKTLGELRTCKVMLNMMILEDSLYKVTNFILLRN